MGDVILAAALFSFLEKKYPDAECVLLTNSLYADLFKEDPRLSQVIAFERNNAHTIFSDLAAQAWDYCIDLQNNRRSRRYIKRYLPGVDTGTFNKLHGRRLLLLFLRINTYAQQSSVAGRYIQTAMHPGHTDVQDIPPVKLYFNDTTIYEKQLTAHGGDPAKPTIALFPFCAWRNKQWPLSRYVSVGKCFRDKKWHVVLFGGPNDVARAAVLKNEIGGSAISLAGTLSLYEIGCFLKRCTLALGGDTGLSHLARACGVKTGIVYGATTRHFGFFPYGEPPFMVFQSNQLCRPCHAHGGHFCWRFSRPCLKNISVDMVINGLNNLIKR